MSERILLNEYRVLSKEPWVNIELENENIYKWNVALMIVNPESLYYGGYFKAKMTFPHNYPYSPPDFKFIHPLFHPNIYSDGKLCISILHPPGEDEMSGETAAERWSPIQGVESVLVSILSLLDDAEVSSPANVDAGVLLRKSKEEFKEMVKKDVEASKRDIPEGFVMPTHTAPPKPRSAPDDPNFWYDSADEDDFGGSDSDEEMMDDDDDEDEDEDEEDADEEDREATEIQESTQAKST
ncbi:MAG: hypothetical protein M1837_006310 [Sclerophora amabilis]|nr:MAG: hypothetical protein M1837_006310 [Sclerophora amabilis]